jgi:hypothetical protein
MRTLKRLSLPGALVNCLPGWIIIPGEGSRLREEANAFLPGNCTGSHAGLNPF